MHKRKVPLVRQLGTTDCGAACLTMLFQYYGYKIDIVMVNALVDTGRNGMSLRVMKKIAEENQFFLKAYSNYGTEENLLRSLPVIMCSCENHFVVISRKDRKGYILLDPIEGRKIITYEMIKKSYQDILVLIRPTQYMQKKAPKTIGFKLPVSPSKFVLAVVLTLITQSIILTPPLLIQKLINQVTRKAADYDLMFFVLMAMLIGCSFFWANWLQKRVILLLENEIYKKTTSKMIDKIFQIDLSFFENHSSGDITNRFHSVNDIYKFISGILITTFIDILTAFICFLVMMYQSYILTGTVVLLTLSQLIFVFLLNHKMLIQIKNYMADQSRLEGILVETLTNIQQIRCMRIDKVLKCSILNKYDNSIEQLKQKNKLADFMESGITSFNIITSLILYALGGFLVLNEKISLGRLISFVTLSSYFINPFRTLSNFLPQLSTLKETMLRLKELMNYKEMEYLGAKSVKHFEKLEMKNLSFSYANNESRDINEVSLDIKKGDKIAIVGPSGSGKTTITKLLLNVFSNYTGVIRVNGENVKEIKEEDIERLFAVVTQIPLAINNTIRDNIDMTGTLTDDKIYKILDLVELKKDIFKFPLKLNTFTGENGQNISGGQKQRIAIARALAASPEIIIFDEATSNLDPVIEKKIYSNLKKLQITQIIITHRLNAIQDADQIYVIEEGKIVERGIHKQLIDNKKTYFEILKTYQ